MTSEVTKGDVNHHLKLAGRTDALFSDGATGLNHQVSRGITGSVNNLARQALLAAYVNRSAFVVERSARQAISEVDSE